VNLAPSRISFKAGGVATAVLGRGLHSSTIHLNLTRF
jgi:hypothetical protein